MKRGELALALKCEIALQEIEDAIKKIDDDSAPRTEEVAQRLDVVAVPDAILASWPGGWTVRASPEQSVRVRALARKIAEEQRVATLGALKILGVEP